MTRIWQRCLAAVPLRIQFKNLSLFFGVMQAVRVPYTDEVEAGQIWKNICFV